MRIVEDRSSRLVLRDRTLWMVCFAAAATLLIRESPSFPARVLRPKTRRHRAGPGV